MAFTFNYKSLYDGQLPNVKTTLYTSVGQTSVQQITLVTSGAVTVDIFLKRNGSSSRRLIPAALPMNNASATVPAMVECLDAPLELSAGDVIEGNASAAATVDAVITGATA